MSKYLCPHPQNNFLTNAQFNAKLENEILKQFSRKY